MKNFIEFFENLFFLEIVLFFSLVLFVILAIMIAISPVNIDLLYFLR